MKKYSNSILLLSITVLFSWAFSISAGESAQIQGDGEQGDVRGNGDVALLDEAAALTLITVEEARDQRGVIEAPIFKEIDEATRDIECATIGSCAICIDGDCAGVGCIDDEGDITACAQCAGGPVVCN